VTAAGDQFRQHGDDAGHEVDAALVGLIVCGSLITSRTAEPRAIVAASRATSFDLHAFS
jgi:hypothetical protein